MTSFSYAPDMRILCLATAVLVLASQSVTAAEDTDVAAARAVFEQNLDAIRQRNRDRYLSLYLRSENLVRSGPAGIATGYEDFAKGAGDNWPDTFDASDIQLVRVKPGVVYGTYRYRVRYGGDEVTGISERLFVNTPDGWKIAVTGAIAAPPGTPPPPRAIRRAKLIDGRGGAPVRDANIVIRNGKIDCAGTACSIPEGVTTIDGAGLWVTPGLIDTHVHFSQTGWADGRPDSLDVRTAHPYEKVQSELKANPHRYAKSYLCSGITSVFDVGGFSWTLALADRFANDTRTPRVVAAGPLLSTLDHWLNLPAERQFIHVKDEATARGGAGYLAAQGAKAVKVWYIVNPELPVTASAPAITAAGEAARKAGIPLIVHATGLAEAKEALRAGARLLVHSVWEPIDDDFIALMKKNGAILTPTLTVVGGYSRMFRAVVDRKPPVVDDPNRCVDPATLEKIASTATLDSSLATPEEAARRENRTSERERIAAENLARLVKAGVPVATGTDAGNPLTLHGPAIYAEMEAMQKAGMTPMQVIVASTATASRALGVEKETGTIEPGKAADLLILTADPSSDVANFRKLRSVVRAGVVRGIEELAARGQ